MSQILITPTEARVLAALVEKSIATPQYYPMTVNAIVAACNQKTARQPVMNLNEGAVGAALNRLAGDSLVARDDAGSRVPKWRHHFQHQLLLKPAALAVLTSLMLRGAQTAAELRASASGLHGPADAEGLMAALGDLSDRAQPLVRLLPRAPGQSTQRYVHLLCGEPQVETAAPDATCSEAPSLQSRVAALEARVAELERRLDDG